MRAQAAALVVGAARRGHGSWRRRGRGRQAVVPSVEPGIALQLDSGRMANGPVGAVGGALGLLITNAPLERPAVVETKDFMVEKPVRTQPLNVARPRKVHEARARVLEQNTILKPRRRRKPVCRIVKVLKPLNEREKDEERKPKIK